jgi:hypothetical protein
MIHAFRAQCVLAAMIHSGRPRRPPGELSFNPHGTGDFGVAYA